MHISAEWFTYHSVQIFESCAEDEMLKDLILRARLCVTVLLLNMVESFISARSI